MSFPNTPTPKKPTCKPKYVVPMRRQEKSGMMVFYLTPELEKEFRRLFPVTMNRRMMELFGISFSTMQRFKRQLGLEKNKAVIRKKLTKQVKKTCEKNGYYESIRGVRPSDNCFKAIHEKFESGWHPMKALKAENTRKYNRICKQRSETRKELIAKERKHISWGLSQTTHLHLPSETFTKSQLYRRSSALKRGYLLGDKGEFSGERFVIFYDEHTERSTIFEQNCINDGFTLKEIKEEVSDRDFVSCID